MRWSGKQGSMLRLSLGGLRSTTKLFPRSFESIAADLPSGGMDSSPEADTRDRRLVAGSCQSLVMKMRGLPL